MPFGSWEKDTLVVDAVGFNDLTRFDNYDRLHSHQDAGHIEGLAAPGLEAAKAGVK